MSPMSEADYFNDFYPDDPSPRDPNVYQRGVQVLLDKYYAHITDAQRQEMIVYLNGMYENSIVRNDVLDDEQILSAVEQAILYRTEHDRMMHPSSRLQQ